jgi:flavodoxin
MNIQIIYDSQYGNTERVARAIAEGLGEDARVDRVDDGTRVEAGVALLVIGGPTQGHGAGPTMVTFLERLPQLDGVAVAAFDTRLTWPKLLSGAASDRIARALRDHGAHLVAEPESFLVTGREGPLVDGELERATSWGHAVRTTVG